MTPRAIGTVLLALLPATTAAQVRIVRYGDDRLAGIREVDALVVVDSAATGGGDGRCLQTSSELQQTVLETLREAGVPATLSARLRSSPHSVVTRIRSAALGPHCATAVESEVVAEVEAIPEADRFFPPEKWGSLLIGGMPLAHEDGLVTSAAEEHRAAVLRTVREQVQALAERLRRANP